MGGGTDEIAFSSGTPVTNHEANEFDFLTASSGGTRQPNGVKESVTARGSRARDMVRLRLNAFPQSAVCLVSGKVESVYKSSNN
ncbi:hypothetical protein L484_021835 [Morus notabilis]|uniref:Uncharacterized protein n=1 Tax=Morus notabilis TaxID=981085 RepID=W9QSQ5_9ROSA|nr:hypothetical protein L484_021835 [Morus notabilis]